MIGTPQHKMIPFFAQNNTTTVRAKSKGDKIDPFGDNPYATVHLQKMYKTLKSSHVEHSQSNKSRINNILNIPFKRISRVEHMIHKHKQQIKQEHVVNDLQSTFNYNYLKPQFKIKTNINPPNKTISKHKALQNSQKKIHLQNISLQCVSRVSTSGFPQQKGSISGNNFQQIFKNRRKLNYKGSHKKQQASLLQMLNRISQGTPLHRYKSKAYESGNKVNSFFHSS